MRLRVLTPVVTLALLSQITAAAQDTTYTPRYETPEGKELVLVYIGAESCVPCHMPELKAAVSGLKLLLAEQATQDGQDFATMGVALDWEVAEGYEFLREVGPWDEVIVGKNWTNLGASEFIWQDPAAPPAIPQVALVEREVDAGGERMRVEGYEVVERRVGADDVVGWYKEGAPLRRE